MEMSPASRTSCKTLPQPESGLEPSFMKRLSGRFFRRYLYRTSVWNAVVIALLVLVFGVLALLLDSADVSVLERSSILSALVALLGITTVLYYGARQATIARRLDVQTLRTEHERRAVEELQLALVQQELPAVSNLRFSATYSPAEKGSNVGGDWYDAFELPHGRIMFSIGDVCGHGVEAAARMSGARHAILTAALQNSDPAWILTRASAALRFPDDKFATAICGYVDTATFEVCYATAGHPPGILVEPDGTASLLRFQGVPLGVQTDEPYETFTFTAKPNALLVFYTDGLVEYDHAPVEGERRMLETARRVALSDAADPADAIRTEICSNCELFDDVAVLTIAFRDRGEAGVAVNGDGERRSVGLRGVRTPFGTDPLPR